MKTIAFFNNKGGVGKTSLCYHLAWAYSEAGMPVVALDLDPQANLTSMFLEDARLEDIWPEQGQSPTVMESVGPILKGTGDIKRPPIEKIVERLGLVAGDLALSRFEDKLSQSWPECHDGNEAAFRAVSAFYRIARLAAEKAGSDVVLMDMGPNLGAINRAALIASDYIVVPLAPDLYSLQGLRNLGPTLNDWRRAWKERSPKNPEPELVLPEGKMEPVGYVIMQHTIRKDRPVRAYDKWISRIPSHYRRYVTTQEEEEFEDIVDDPCCLALLKHYRSLMPMAMEARKPMFHLKPADGAIGSHAQAVVACGKDFDLLAKRIARKSGISIRPPQQN